MIYIKAYIFQSPDRNISDMLILADSLRDDDAHVSPCKLLNNG